MCVYTSATSVALGRTMRRAHGFLDARAVLLVFLSISGLECVWCVGRVQAVDFLVLCWFCEICFFAQHGVFIESWRMFFLFF